MPCKLFTDFYATRKCLEYVGNDFNTYLANVPILYLLKTPENQRFSGIFRGYKMRTYIFEEIQSGITKNCFILSEAYSERSQSS